MSKQIIKYLLVITAFLCYSSPSIWAQSSDAMVPKDAVTVISINNTSLLKKIQMDSLIQYEFMEDVQSEMFDGSADNKSLKDAGIDFNQKFHVFYGKTNLYELSGFTFGISEKTSLLQVFDDYEKTNIKIPSIEYYRSYFNHLIIKDKKHGLVLRVDPNEDRVKKILDSIWTARGNGYVFEDKKIEAENESTKSGEDEPIYKILNNNELEEDDSETAIDTSNVLYKTYFELRDSISTQLQSEYLKQILDELLINNINLQQQDPKFNQLLSHESEGIIYIDNSRNFQYAKGFWYFQTMFPELFKDIKTLYTGNVIMGDIFLRDNKIELKFNATYGQKLGEIYERLNSTKFDKKVLNYIHQDSPGFFTYNINLKEGFEKAYDIIIPLLKNEKDPRVTSNVLKAELLHEFINTDAVFDTYKGSMFGTFNGMKKVKTKRIEFSYDETTFAYSEKEVIGEEDMPIFTIGFSTGRADIPEKILQYMSRMTSRFKKIDHYWKIEDAVLNSVPAYIIANKEGLLIVTNDEDLAINHVNGYGNQALSGNRAKQAKKSKFMYAYVNIGQVLNKIPKQIFTNKQNEILNSIRGKEGYIELTTEKTTPEHTNFDINYYFEGKYTDSGKYLLDLINSAFILAK